MLNLGVPAWECLLTEQEKVDLEKVLKKGLKIIWGPHYTTFEEVTKEAHIQTVAQVHLKQNPENTRNSSDDLLKIQFPYLSCPFFLEFSGSFSNLVVQISEMSKAYKNSPKKEGKCDF